jgi:hypothetical protein
LNLKTQECGILGIRWVLVENSAFATEVM